MTDDDVSERINGSRDRDKQVNFRVTESRYRTWQKHVGKDPEKDFPTMSDLIRYAVEQEVSTADAHTKKEATGSDQSQVADEVIPTLSRIESQLEDLQDRVKALEREDTEPTQDAERAVYELLPQESELDGLDGARSIRELAKLTGLTTEQVHHAIESINDRREETIIADDGLKIQGPDQNGPTMYYLSE